MSQPKKKSSKKAKATRAPGAAAAPTSTDSPPNRRTAKPSARKRSNWQQKQRRQNTLFTAGVIAVVLAVIGWVVFLQVDKRRLQSELTAGSCQVDSKTDAGIKNEHSNNPVFTVNPPAGGIHLPTAARPGDYSSGEAPADGLVVHALEHGDVAIWYKPSVAGPDLEALRKIYADDDSSDVLLVPRADMPTNVAATAWHKRLLCERVEPAVISKFVKAYRDNGPENVGE